jgi:integrase
MKVAFEWLRDGIPKKNKVVKVHDLSLKDMVRKLKSLDEADTLLAEMRRLGWVKTYVRKETPGAEDLITFLKTFWDWDTSPYIEEKLRETHGIHKRHCKIQKQAIALYWEPFFKGRFLGEITFDDIEDFIKHLGKKDLSASRKNLILKAGFQPLRWKFNRGKIEVDPTRGHTMFTGEESKREILTPTVAAAVFRAIWQNDRAKLANMLASVTGMRNGEITGLRLKDIGPDCIYVNSSWNSEDKLKTTKNNKTRVVEIPFPEIIKGLLAQAKQNPWGDGLESFVFWSTTRSKSPMQGWHFVRELRIALIQTGYSKESADKIDFHGWRHFFTSYMVGKINKKLLKGETGHLTDIMIDHYSDHVTVGDRELIQAKKRETFAGLFPEKVLLLEYKGELKTSVA